jgi:carbamoyltransferase
MIYLGIASEHCSSAALMQDGLIIGLVQEERLSLRKNQVAFPIRAIRALVDQHLSGDASRIDAVIFGGQQSDPHYAALDRFSDFSIADHVREQHELWYPHFYGQQRNDGSYWQRQFAEGKQLNKEPGYDFSWLAGKSIAEAAAHFVEVERPAAVRRHLGNTAAVTVIDHHTCHAYYAYYGASVPARHAGKTLVLTADGWGDGCNWSAWVDDTSGKLTKLASGPRNTVARIYKWATLILGMKPNEHEYKVMGLSGYSQSRRHIEEVEQVFFEALDFDDGEFVSAKPLKDSYFDLRDRLEGLRFDNISAGLQGWASKLTAKWAKYWLRNTGRRSLCFSGGLSMNIKMNGELLSLPDVEWLSVPASGGDESLSAGACFAHVIMTGAECSPLRHVYLGASAGPDVTAWADRLAETGMAAGDLAIREGVDADAASLLLTKDCVLARCVGPSEFGARALGNRSILANPSNPANLKFINDAIKNRDFWMPFTPSMLAEHANTYLVNPKNVPSPFMTIGYQTRPERRADIVAALHPGDFSARPQFVDRATNPDYWELIEAFRRRTGIPVLLNTSLNLHGEPMNYSLADAVRTLCLSQLDFLLAPGDRLIYKKRAVERLEGILGRGGRS